MNTKVNNLLTTTTLTLCGMLLSAPFAMAAENETMHRADENFIKESAAHNMAEVKLAELGAKNAVNPEVKAYAERVVTDHTAFHKSLTNLAKTKGIELSEDKKSDPSMMYRSLEKSKGTDFDGKFLDQMVSSHKKDVSNYEKASKDTKDSEVKAFADKRLPTLRAHLEKATELSASAKTEWGNMRDRDDKKTKADNTGRNVRDRDGKELTPFDQGSSKSDTEITAAIRKEIMEGEEMSVNAKNVKIITLNGKVTLRGPVNSAEEKRIITEIAARIVNPSQVDSQLEVK